MESIDSGYRGGFAPLSCLLKAASGMVNAAPHPTSLRGGVADAAIQFHRPTDAIVDSKTADRKNAGVKRQLRSAASLSSPANLGPL